MSQIRRFARNRLPVILWMLVVFVGSTDLLSSQRTSRIIGPLLRWIKPDISEAAIRRAQMVARKAAHLTEYAVLAVLIRRALSNPSPGQPAAWRWSDAVWALALSALFAVSDEVHQSFYATRYASALDVLIDTAGATIGLGLVWISDGSKKRM